MLSLKHPHEWLASIDKKEHKLYLLYPFADWILIKTGLGRLLDNKRDVTDTMKSLYHTMKTEQIKRLFWCCRLSSVIVIVVIFDIFSLFSQLKNLEDSVILNGRFLKRPTYGEGSSQVELNVTMEQQGASSKESQSQKVSIDVNERTYKEDELIKIFEQIFDYLEKNVLGENESADKIYKKLNFIKSIPGTSISVKWEPENYELIETDGTVYNEELEKNGSETTVKAILTYQKQRAERSMSFHIMPKQYSEEEILAKKLKEELDTASSKSENDELLELPDTIGSYKLSWRDGEEDNTGAILLLLGIIMAAAAWTAGEKDLEKRLKQRKKQMLLDYPELVNKFTLLVNAGMTIKQAWIKIAVDYLNSVQQKKCKRHYAYEEMLTTLNEIKLGLPENLAYEQYGRRAGLIPYIRFSSLIAQNLKKGSKGFTGLMRKEAMEAFEERKEIAKRLGEEAGTKLLIPMMLMLIMVFLIIMIPAFMTFKM